MFKVVPGGFSLLPWAVFFTLFQRAREGRKKESERLVIRLQLNQKVYMFTKFIQQNQSLK